MRRIPRIARSIDLLDTSRRPSSASTLCRACQHRTAPPSTAAAFSSASRRQLGDPEKARPFTEKLRNKIWGTEVAPGQEDPYAPGSPWRQAKYKKDSMQDQEHEPQELQPRSHSEPVSERPVDMDKASEKKPRSRRRVSKKYTPAQTWQGLEWVGGDEWLLKQKEKERPRFRVPFLPKKKALEPADIIAALRKASLEICAERTKSVRPDSTEDQAPDVDVKTGNTEHVVETTKKNTENQTAAWQNASLSDPDVKLAFVKRVMRLTDLRIPDPVIGAADTVQVLVDRLKPSNKPKKLAEVLQQAKQLPTLPNVKILAHRVTSKAKEEQLGRWKVIEKELKERNLFWI